LKGWEKRAIIENPKKQKTRPKKHGVSERGYRETEKKKTRSRGKRIPLRKRA